MTDSDTATGYLDTCVVSGLAQQDLTDVEQDAMLEILRLHKRRVIQLVTSSVAKEEIEKVPKMFRAKHEVIYNLLNDIPTSTTSWMDSGLMLMGVGGGTREDPLFSELKMILPDPMDAQHVFQAIKSEMKYFVTTDNQTILKHRTLLQSKYKLKLVTPFELLAAITQHLREE